MSEAETDRDTLRKAGIALLLGGAINILRAIPIAMSEGVTADNFPPKTAMDIVVFAQFPVWRASHAAAVVAAVLILFGLSVLVREAVRRGQAGPALMTLVGIGSSMMLFLVAFVSDGIVLSFAVENMVARGADHVAAQTPLIEYAHFVATGFAGVSAALMLITALFLGLTLMRAFGARRLGVVGIAIGLVSAAGYLSGVLSLNFSRTIHFVGPLAVITFLYFSAIGIAILRGGLGAVADAKIKS